MRYVVKYCTGGQATNDNTAHMHCKRTLRICITYCFYTVTMVVQTRLNVTLHVHCLSSLPLNLVIPQPKSQAGVPPLVGCTGQFNRHIRSKRNCVPCRSDDATCGHGRDRRKQVLARILTFYV
jgi:hypothetical protein